MAPPCDSTFLSVERVACSASGYNASPTKNRHTVIFANIIDSRFEILHLLRTATNSHDQHTADRRKTKRFIHSYSLPFLFNSEI